MLGVPRSSNRQYILLHAVIEMADPTRQGRLVGEGFKPPKGAAVKSHGAERLGLKVLMESGSGVYMGDEPAFAAGRRK